MANNNKQKQPKNKKHQCNLELATTRTRGTADPRPVLDAVTMQHRTQLVLNLTTADPTHNVTLSEIMASVPGGPTMWPKVRIAHYEAWGGDGNVQNQPLTLQILTNTGEEFGGDQASFTDSGTSGSRRSHVSIRPGLFQRAQWADGSSTNPVLRVSSPVPATGSQNVILQVSLELRSLTV